MLDKVVIHCSASPQGRGDDAATIHGWHLERGWSGIGYHWVILEDGTRQAGRPEYWMGSHAKGHNTGSVGICLIGNENFTDEQYSELVALLREIKAENPAAVILGHYELNPGKSCPNFGVPEFLAEHGFLGG
jgi:N-acetylmuramoyl-L-alanine amidase